MPSGSVANAVKTFTHAAGGRCSGHSLNPVQNPATMHRVTNVRDPMWCLERDWITFALANGRAGSNEALIHRAAIEKLHGQCASGMTKRDSCLSSDHVSTQRIPSLGPNRDFFRVCHLAPKATGDVLVSNHRLRCCDLQRQGIHKGLFAADGRHVHCNWSKRRNHQLLSEVVS